MLTDLQRKKQEHIFKLLDFDKNGVIEEEDFFGIAENLCVVKGEELDTEEYDRILAMCTTFWNDLKYYIDENKDNKCSLEEWVKFVDERIVNSDMNWYDQYVNAVVSGLFDLYDDNGDGVISVNEFLDLFLSFRMEARYVAKSFKQLDLNNDRYITKEELIHAVYEFMRSEDENAPGNWLFGDWTNTYFEELIAD